MLPSEPKRNWVTPRQYSILADLSFEETKRQLEAGRIRGIKVNNVWRIYPDELRRNLGVTHPKTIKGDNHE